MKILILANNDIGLFKFRRELLEKLVEEYETLMSKNLLYMIEAQFCLGGTHFYKVIEKEYGIDIMKRLIEYARRESWIVAFGLLLVHRVFF